MTKEERIAYYRNGAVRDRITEYLGGAKLQNATCHYLTAGDEHRHHLDDRWTNQSLEWLLANGSEVYRSLWDERSLLVDFDIEYVNFDRPTEPFLNPERIFALQEPVVETIQGLFAHYGIKPLQFLTGRGHHFIWRVRRDSEPFRRLVALAHGPESLWLMEAEPHTPHGRSVGSDLAHAFAGLGLLMEFLAHRTQEAAAPKTQVPVELTAVEVGPSDGDREMISIDISEYGDPLYSRMVRVPFSVYLKPLQQAWKSDRPAPEISTVLVVPIPEEGYAHGLRLMRDLHLAAEFASSARTEIPEAEDGTSKLLTEYEKSALAGFHRFYYAEEPHPAKDWPATYDRFSYDVLPGCVRSILEQPNDLLLRPACIRHLTRVLLALGWHPRHVAGLIHSKYARPFGWTQLEGYDPLTRADFYTRLFSGLFFTGRDDLIDLNCVSAQEQGICLFAPCGDNLLRYRASALYRREHDKLAHRPFNRLLSPTEHC